MGVIKLLAAPIRSLLRFPLFQLGIVIVVILLLQGADDRSLPGEVFSGLDKLVEYSVQSVAAFFNVKSFTRSWLVSSLMIAYVYLACLLLLVLVRIVMRAAVDLLGRHNVLWLRTAIARERGIAAYRAWLPFERIRPAHVPQHQWEEMYAWPADNRPPYLPLGQRVLRALCIYVLVVVVAAAALQLFTPFAVMSWLGEWARGLVG